MKAHPLRWNLKRWPLRWKVTLLTAALVTLILLGVRFLACWHLYRAGVSDLDKELNAVAHEFFTRLADRNYQVDWATRTAVHELMPPSHYPYMSQILDDHGNTLFRSRWLDGNEVPVLPPDAKGFVSMDLNDHPVRVGNFTQNQIHLRLAMTLHTVELAREVLVQSFLIGAPVVLLFVGIGGWNIARWTLAPIEEMAQTAKRISAQQLDQRLPLPQTGDEVEHLTVVLNHMFDRLQASFHSATRFTSDASHELKTPLTIIRGELEEALRSFDFEPAQEKLLVNLMEETERLTQITDGLLLLSRADSGRLALQRAPVDLAERMRDLLEDAEILGAASEIEVESELPREAWILADPGFLKQLLLNLLDNSIKYNEHGGRVKVGLRRERGDWRICIENTGPGVSPETVTQLFERFFRGDESRSQRAGHGLGLSICREIVRAHGGEIGCDISRPGWTQFWVTIPATEPPAHPVRGEPEPAFASL